MPVFESYADSQTISLLIFDFRPRKLPIYADPCSFFLIVVSVLNRAVNCQPGFCAATRRADIRFSLMFDICRFVFWFSNFRSCATKLFGIELFQYLINFRCYDLYRKRNIDIQIYFGEIRSEIMKCFLDFNLFTFENTDLRWPLFFLFISSRR